MITPQDKLVFELQGEVEVTFIEPQAPPGEVFQRFQLKNHISDSAVDILLGLLGRDMDNKIVSTISIGTGGDVNPTTGLDTGARFAPEDGETEMRQPIFNAPIAHVETDSINKRITYTAVLKTEEGNSDSINELGLLSEDGTMMSHFITPVGGGGRATKYEKTDLLYMVVRWKLIPALRRS
jgi:hypothetical protein